MFSTAVTAQAPQGVWESEGRKGQAVDVEDVGQQPGSPSRAWLQAGLPPVQP